MTKGIEGRVVSVKKVSFHEVEATVHISFAHLLPTREEERRRLDSEERESLKLKVASAIERQMALLHIGDKAVLIQQ
jgi:hypothetical protein